MVKRLFFILLLLPFFCFGQNLVNNPSFEDTVVCPTGVNEISNSDGWYSLIQSPDYYHTCAPWPVSVPSNIAGQQNAATGNAYSGYWNYEVFTGREMFGSKLPAALIIGQDYFVSFKVSLADNTTSVNCGTNKLGIIFSVDSVAYFNVNFAHVYTDSIITDTENWTTVFGSFTADSAYKYMMIGNFFDNNNTDTVMISPFPLCRSYYYVDDICVSSDSTCYVVTGIPGTIPKQAIRIFPNPTTGIFTVTNSTGEIQVYDLFSRLLLRSNKEQIDMSNYPAGLYIWQVGTQRGKLVKE